METKPDSSIERKQEYELIRRIMAGESREYSTLVSNYQNKIYSMVVRQVGDKEVAKELTQDAFVKAYFNLKGFRFDSSFSTWLYRIALNTTSNYFSSKRFKELQKQKALKENMPNDTQEKTTQEEERKLQALREEAATLSPKLRDVITLCGFEGKSYEEAAGILHIPIGTIRSRLNKARLILKDKLREVCYE